MTCHDRSVFRQYPLAAVSIAVVGRLTDICAPGRMTGSPTFENDRVEEEDEVE
jgi:hypothetical protein